tara:strand:- start:265 stop:783 length:519 start_codon:yes stop_codon:yes gene_type:complete
MNYEEKDWPSLPEGMISDLVSYTLAADPIGGAAASAEDASKNSVYGVVAAPDYLSSWVKDNLPLSNEYFIGLQRFTNLFASPIHKDSIRRYCYNNVLTTGEPTTAFFDDDKKLIERVRYKQNRWYYHNTDVFHKVTEMRSSRVAVTIFKPIASRTGNYYELADKGANFLKAI